MLIIIQLKQDTDVGSIEFSSEVRLLKDTALKAQVEARMREAEGKFSSLPKMSVTQLLYPFILVAGWGDIKIDISMDGYVILSVYITPE